MKSNSKIADSIDHAQLVSNNSPKVAIIIVHYQNFDNLNACIHSLRKRTYSNSSIIIVDNNSGSLETIRSRFHEAVVLPSKVNLGFAQGNNVGIEYALREGAEYIFLLNDDTVVEEDTIAQLVESIHQLPDAGAVQPLLLRYNDHSIVDSAGQRLLSKGGAEDIMDCDASLGVQEIFGPCAAASLYRAEVFRTVGLFDESLFVIHEDTDLSMRMRLAGYRSYLVPSAIVYHKRGVSGSASKRNPITGFFSVRNLIILSLRYWPIKYLILYLPLYIVRFLLLLHRTKQCGYTFTQLYKPLLRALSERKNIRKHPELRQTQRRWIVSRGYRYLFQR